MAQLRITIPLGSEARAGPMRSESHGTHYWHFVTYSTREDSYPAPHASILAAAAAVPTVLSAIVVLASHTSHVL